MAVVEPLRIASPPQIHPGRRIRSKTLRNKCLKRPECICATESHPLDLSPPFTIDSGYCSALGSDSDDSCLESSYNESIVSTALTEYSFMSTSMLASSLFKLSSLRLATTAPSVFTTLATAKATKTPVLARPTQSKLLKLFRAKESPQAEPFPELKRSLSTLAASSSNTLTNSSSSSLEASSRRLFGRLYGDNITYSETPSFSARQSFLALFMNYSMLGLTRFSVNNTMSMQQGSLDDVSSEMHPTKEEELITYSEYSSDSLDVSYNGSKARNREYRINCDFLKRYALDYSARLNFVLPSSSDDVAIMVHKGNLNRFDNEHGLARILEMSREKLWNLVVLQPRGDAFPALSVDTKKFVFDGDSEHRYRSIVVKKGNYIPWATHKSGLKPAGVLRGVKPLSSPCSPTLGKTAAQYTIKGWSSERWSDLSSEVA